MTSTRVSSVLWRFAPMIYGPTILFALGEGAVIPLIPILAAERGADVADLSVPPSAASRRALSTRINV